MRTTSFYSLRGCAGRLASSGIIRRLNHGEAGGYGTVRAPILGLRGETTGLMLEGMSARPRETVQQSGVPVVDMPSGLARRGALGAQAPPRW